MRGGQGHVRAAHACARAQPHGACESKARQTSFEIECSSISRSPPTSEEARSDLVSVSRDRLLRMAAGPQRPRRVWPGPSSTSWMIAAAAVPSSSPVCTDELDFWRMSRVGRGALCNFEKRVGPSVCAREAEEWEEVEVRGGRGVALFRRTPPIAPDVPGDAA